MIRSEKYFSLLFFIFTYKGCKVVLAKTIAGIHGVTIGNLNKLIVNNSSRFNNNDLKDLKQSEDFAITLKKSELYTQNSINASSSIFLLSERGYVKLVSMMDNSNEKKWEVMDKLVNEYFAMRENQVSLSKEQSLVLDLYAGGVGSILAHKELVSIQVDKVREEEQLQNFKVLANDLGFITMILSTIFYYLCNKFMNSYIR